MSFVVATFYKFVELDDYVELKEKFHSFCLAHDIVGTILLAKEGINSTISGTESNLAAVLDFIQQDPRLANLPVQYDYSDKQPFFRMKIKLRKEIVTIGLPEVDPRQKVGTYVAPKDWNALLEDEDVLVIDTRNQYEIKVGTFKHAVNPGTVNFRDFPEYVKEQLNSGKQKKVAMFCTGGIRCEKASSYMLEAGFDEVFHLKGGILNYLREISNEESLWEGECFVFDQRVTVTADMEQGHYVQCHACRSPVSDEEQKSPHFKAGVSCPACYDSLPEKTRLRAEARQLQVELAGQRKQKHLGVRFVKH